MDYQLICNKKVSNRYPLFLSGQGSNRNSYYGGFAGASNTFDTFADTITASANIVFTGVSIIAANDKSDSRAIPLKSNRFLFKLQFWSTLAQWYWRIQ
jgi:hypothetical protein